MINETTLVAIDPLLTKLNAANVSIVAAPNTLLGALVAASNSPIVCGYQGESGFTEAWLKSLEVDMVFGVAGRQVSLMRTVTCRPCLVTACIASPCMKQLTS